MENIQKQIEELKELLHIQTVFQKEILSAEDAIKYLNISKSCLYKLTHKAVIPYYNPGGKKLYFKKSELDEWISDSRVSTDKELEAGLNTYLSKPLVKSAS